MPYIFISYAREDIHIARMIAQQLKLLKIEFWMDEGEIKVGEKWEESISAAIRKSNGAIFVLSRFSIEKTGYIQKELELLIHEANARADAQFLLPVRIVDNLYPQHPISQFHMIEFRPGDPDSLKSFVSEITTGTFNALEKSEKFFQKNSLANAGDKAAVKNSLSDAEFRKQYKVHGEASGTLFLPSELDLYMNRIRLDAYVFFNKDIDLSIDYVRFDHGDASVLVHYLDGTILDLGVKVQWLIRPHLMRATDISFVQTKNGQTTGKGILVPIKHVNKKTVPKRTSKALFGELRSRFRDALNKKRSR